MIDISSYNQRIEIQQLTSTKDSKGNPEQIWTTIDRRWAKADISSGTAIYTRHERQSASAGYDGPEFYAAGQELVETKVMFEIRYAKRFEMIDTNEYRIIWKTRVYDIKAVNNDCGRNEKLIITAIAKDSNHAISSTPENDAASEGSVSDG